MLDLWKISAGNLLRKGIRTALTIVGIAIGVSSVMLIAAIGQTGAAAINRELDSLGLSGVSVSADDNTTALTMEDLQLLRQLSGIEQATPIIAQTTSVSHLSKIDTALAWGVDVGAESVISTELLYGRTMESVDINTAANVCLVDETLAQELYHRENIVGKTVSLQIGNISQDYKIIGVMKQGSGILSGLVGEYIPSFIYLPYTTMQNLTGDRSFSQIAVKFQEGTDVDAASTMINKRLELERGVSQTVQVNNLSRQRDRLANLMDIIQLVLSAIGVITLLVAGLGIMTVMLVSVSERTREIGVKKAIGAGVATILSEFLLEALTISAVGSAIGTAIALTVCKIVSVTIGLTMMVSVGSLAGAAGTAMATGAIFGVYPAVKAARMKPVEALRRE